MNKTLLLLMLLGNFLFQKTASSQISQHNHQLYINTYFNTEKYNKCIDYIDSINTTKQPSIDNIKIKADCYYALEKYDTARVFYLKAYKSNPKLALLELAKCYARNKQNDSVIYFLTLHLNSREKAIINHIKTDGAFKSLKESDAWNNLWQNDWYSKSELLLADADYEFRLHNYDEALDILEKITSKRKSMHEAFVMQANIYYLKKDYKSALYFINKAIKLKAKRMDYLYKKAVYELALDKRNKALKTINSVFQKDSSNINYYILRAECNLGVKNIEKALLDIESVNNIIIDEYSLFLKAKIYYEDHAYLNTLKPLNICISKFGSKQDYLWLRANTYYKLGVYKYAEKDFSSLLDYLPTNGEIYYWRGMCRLKQNNREAACNDWQKARKYLYIKVDDLIERYCH